MKNEIIPFNFKGYSVRSLIKDNAPWFVAKDVCGVLGIQQAARSVENFPKNEILKVSSTYLGSRGSWGGASSFLCVNEPGIYRLIFQSRKPEAEQFKTWVFNEVLPQIRKTGSYSAPAVEGLQKSLMIAQSERNTYKRLWEEERHTVRRFENRNFLTVADKREILTLYINKYPVSAIQRITKKGRIRIKNFISEVLKMDDPAMDAMFAEWKRADASRGKEAV